MARKKQQGIVLLICLMLLIMVMLLGVSAAQLYLQGEQAARGERDREVAFQSAEDTLMDAELDIQCGPGGTGNPSRCAAFNVSTVAQSDASSAPPQTSSSAALSASLSLALAAPGESPTASLSGPSASSPSAVPAVAPVVPAAFATECGVGGAAAAVGLRLRAPASGPPVWQSVDLSGSEDGGACTVTHGAFTGAEMQTGQGFLPFKKPRYLIERMECHQPGDDAAVSAGPHYCYRVTAIGFGAKPGMEVVLQTVFAKPE